MANQKNLRINQPIVDKTGMPTHFFMRLIQDRGVVIGDTETQVDINTAAIDVNTTNITINAAAIADIEAIDITSVDGTVTVLNGSLGNGGLDIDLEVEEQAVLDKISTTQGTILYRGASDWAALSPGTALQVLTTNGAGADPTWEDAAAGGGGGGASFSGAVVRVPSDITAVNASGGSYIIPFGTGATRFDTHSFHDEATNNTRLTIPSGVDKVQFFAGIQAELVTANSTYAFNLYKNGVQYTGGVIKANTKNLGEIYDVWASPPIEVVAGDYFELRFYCSDTSITIKADRTYFGVKVVDGSVTSGGAAHRGALVYHAGTTGVNLTGGFTTVSFTNESYDTDAIHDNSTNPSRLTVPAGVTKVRISGQVAINNSTGDKESTVIVRKNGGAFVGSPYHRQENGANTWAINLTSPVLVVVAGDYFELEAYNESDTSVDYDSNGTWFSMEIIE